MHKLDRRKLREKVNKKHTLIARILLVTISAVILSLVYVAFHKIYWEKDGKMVVLYQRSNGGVNVVVFDAKATQINDYFVPGLTELEVSRGLGRWKVKSIWELGVNEGVGGGELLTESLTKHAAIPVFLYSDENGYQAVSSGFKGVVRSLVSVKNTNVPFADRLALGTFALGVKNTKRIDVDLAETSYLIKKKLTDGSAGFVFSETSPLYLSSVFAHPVISRDYPNFLIIDKSGAPAVTGMLSNVIGVLGGKVQSINKEDTDSTICEIKSERKDVSNYLAKLLGCRGVTLRNKGSFDIELTIGSGFAKKY